MESSSFIGPINLGNPHEFTMLELAEQVIELTGSHSQVTYQPLPEDDPVQRQPNIDKARKELDWEPQIQLKEGLEQVINYFRQELSV